MKTLLVAIAAITSGLGLGYSLPEQAPQDKKPTAPPAAQDAPKPGAEHAMLGKLVGTWDAVATMHDEKGVEQKTKGTMKTSKHGDFFTVDDYQGEMMGQKFVGHGVNGYCPVRKKYFTFWSDSLTPSPLLLMGNYDAGKKEMTMTCEGVGMSGKLEPMKSVTRCPDDDHCSFALFGPGPDGKEMQLVRVDYTRKK